jgi:hypothetical protein
MTKILAKWGKQPGETLDFDVSYADFLHVRSDTFNLIDPESSILIDVEDGITLEQFQLISGYTAPEPGETAVLLANSVVKLWLSGGVDGETYKVTIKGTTAGGREKHSEIQITVKEV